MADRTYKKVLTMCSTVTTGDTVTIAELITISGLRVFKNLYSFDNIKVSVSGNVITIDESGLTDVDVTIVASGG